MAALMSQLCSAAICSDDSGSESCQIAPKLTAEPKMTPREVNARIAIQKNILAHGSTGIAKTFVLDVQPDPKADRDVQERQSNIARMINQQATKSNYVPEERLRHFEWMNKPTTPQIVGWSGTILSVDQAEDGSERVRVRVAPSFGGKFLTSDFTIETFRIADGVVHPVAIEGDSRIVPKVITAP
jgi:hypothetical protein